MRNYRFFLLILLFTALAAVWVLIQPNAPQAPLTRQTRDPLPGASDGFARATGPIDFSFPADHGPHPEYLTEWWYYTGNLADKNGRHFGYQLTFFRRALAPLSTLDSRSSPWSTSQVYMAHLALTDVSAGEHESYERLSRASAGLSGAQAEPFRVWLEDWQVSSINSNEYFLTARQGELSLDLILRDFKGPIPQGHRGFSQKGPDSGQASYYYSLTRLETEGKISNNGQDFQVSGTSWMDHEYSTSVLSSDQIGWDWFSIQLNNNTEIMVFQLRRADGSIDPFSSGAFITANGDLLEAQDFTISITEEWKSPETQAIYPAGWILNIPEFDLLLKIQPLLADQELNLSYTYWEGAVEIKGNLGLTAVSGYGYVEMTGYTQSIGTEF